MDLAAINFSDFAIACSIFIRKCTMNLILVGTYFSENGAIPKFR